MKSRVGYVAILLLFLLQGLVAAEARVAVPGPAHDCGAATTTAPGDPVPADDCCPADAAHACCGFACSGASPGPAAAVDGVTVAARPAFPAPPALAGWRSGPATRPPIG